MDGAPGGADWSDPLSARAESAAGRRPGTVAARGSLLPPAPVVRLAVVVAGVLVLATGVGVAIGGLAVALPIAMGFTASALPATKVPARQALLLAVPSALAGMVAVGVNGQALPAAGFMALTCLLIAPANAYENGLLSSIPTVVSIYVCIGAVPEPAVVGGWMLFGSVVAVLVLSRLREEAPPDRLPERAAWLHAAVMAAATGVAVYLVTLYPMPHGYWIAMTLTIVLRPYGHETTAIARQRIAGTVGGGVAALALAILAPPWVHLAVALVLLVMMLAYTVTGQYVLFVACLTPFIILLSSGTRDVVDVVLERVGITLVASVLAGLIALAVARRTRHIEADAQAARGPG